jgi:hypothetical protein
MQEVVARIGAGGIVLLLSLDMQEVEATSNNIPLRLKHMRHRVGELCPAPIKNTGSRFFFYDEIQLVTGKREGRMFGRGEAGVDCW